MYMPQNSGKCIKVNIGGKDITNEIKNENI
jgi:hypothetical protein